MSCQNGEGLSSFLQVFKATPAESQEKEVAGTDRVSISLGPQVSSACMPSRDAHIFILKNHKTLRST